MLPHGLNIALIEPFFTGSHKKWAKELSHHSKHNIQLFTLPGHHWKWRMHGAAITLANQLLESDFQPDLVLATDMLDLSTFLALIRSEFPLVPSAIYFHENQISYPWSPTDQDLKLGRDNHYGFINYASALAANAVLFNSEYHKTSFLGALPSFLGQFPDYTNQESIGSIKSKSTVLHLGLDLEKLNKLQPDKQNTNKIPIITWNHRWEYDKNPEEFFAILEKLKVEQIPFQLCMLGKQLPKSPKIFKQARDTFKDEIIHWGYAESEEEYYRWLWKSDILFCTSNQDFFGISVVEGMFCNTYPILPKRLAYPEHLSDSNYFYSTSKEAYQTLKSQLLKVDLFNGADLIRYDWKSCIQKYDDCFSSLAAE